MAAHGTGLALFPVDGDEVEPLPHMNHIAFRVDRASFEATRERLPERGVEVRLSDHGRSDSIYFTDPDGRRLELTTYDVPG